MDRFTIEIPIYGGNFTIVFADDFVKYTEQNKIGVILKPTSNNCIGLAVRSTENPGFDYLVFFKNDKVRPEIIAHEALHICNYVFNDRGVATFTDENEHQAYFIDWICEMIVYAAVKCDRKITLMLGGYVMPLMYPTNEKHKKVLRDLRKSK